MSNGQTLDAEVDLLELNGTGGRTGQQIGKVRLMASNGKHGTLLFGAFNGGFLRQLGQAKWVELQIGPSEWFEAVNTSGAKQAIDGLTQCARAL